MKTAKELKLIADQKQVPDEEELEILEMILQICEEEANKGKYQISIFGNLHLPYGFPDFRNSTFRLISQPELFIDFLKLKYQLKLLGFGIRYIKNGGDILTNPVNGSSRLDIELIIRWGDSYE